MGTHLSLITLAIFLLIMTGCSLGPRSNYEQPCNDKYHGVLIGDRCFDCGANDGLCPDDFSEEPVCAIIKDKDCQSGQ